MRVPVKCNALSSPELSLPNNSTDFLKDPPLLQGRIFFCPGFNKPRVFPSYPQSHLRGGTIGRWKPALYLLV